MPPPSGRIPNVSHGPHPHLLSPIRVGTLKLRNRIVLPAMDQNNCDDGLVTDRTIAAMEMLIDRIKATKTNAAFFDAMKRN